MPLHLLGKKSWNPYNADNIARVRRDEALAKAKEEEEERRMQEVDAERRLAILRGEAPLPLSPVEDETPTEERKRAPREGGKDERRKRKRAGEDDTEYELRLAMERSEAASTARENLKKPPAARSDAPLVGRDGHIDLFGEQASRRPPEKNEEAEREKEKKKREFEDQYRMRLSSAAGKDGSLGPWYSKAGGKDVAALDVPGKDAFGREDPDRPKRDAERLFANDPLAAMKRGAAKVRDLTKERRRKDAEREQQLRELKDVDESRREKRRKRENGHRRSRDRERFTSRSRSRSPHRRREGDRRERDRHRDERSPRRRADDERSSRHHQSRPREARV